MEAGEEKAGDDSAETLRILQDLAAARDFFLEASLTLQDALYDLDRPGRTRAAEQVRAVVDRMRQ